MDGRGRELEIIFIERLWRSVKYECLYLHGFETVPLLEQGLADYFAFFATSDRIRGWAIAHRPKCIKREKDSESEPKNDDDSSALEHLSRQGEQVYPLTTSVWQRLRRLPIAQTWVPNAKG